MNLQRITAVLREFGPAPKMSKADRLTWAQPTDLGGLGHVCADWIERKVDSRPGYQAGYGLEPADTTPDQERALIVANRNGFFTHQSQRGQSEKIGRRLYVQHAAVSGFADWELVERLRAVADEAGLGCVIGRAGGRRYDYSSAVPVSFVNGKTTAEFGVVLPRRHIRDSWMGFGICSPKAQEALCQAPQVTLYDRAPGRDYWLWKVLEAVVTDRQL